MKYEENNILTPNIFQIYDKKIIQRLYNKLHNYIIYSLLIITFKSQSIIENL